jgi:hypothetical protein
MCQRNRHRYNFCWSNFNHHHRMGGGRNPYR